MKKTITLMSLLISSMSFSQLPTITATNQIPAIGDTIYYTDGNSFGFDPNGSGGAIDVIWDYSNLSPVTPVTFWYEDPATTLEAANFPNSNVALANSVQAGYEYFETTASSISRWGYTSGGGIYYDNSFQRYTFPITPGVIQNTPLYTGTMSSFGAGEDSVTIANGTYQANPDAYGTLSLPPLTFGGVPEVFDSVIRVHVNETFQIILWFSGAPALTINVSDDYYFFFDEETQEPVLIYGVTTDDAGGSPQTVLRYQHTIQGTGGASSGAGLVENVNTRFKAFPNPATDEIAITFENSTERIITLFSAEGKKMESLNSNATEAKFDVSNLPSGVYMIKVRTGSDLSVKRVVVK